MSFRKRNVPLSGSAASISSSRDEKLSRTGVRISPLTSHPTISTGTASLDKLLGLGAGLALGTNLLIEEEGTTDFASALLRCFAAEGIIQKQKVFAVVPDGWANQLPGVVDSKERTLPGESERMKIAWRYENLGAHGEERIPPGMVQRTVQPSSVIGQAELYQQTFCHTFDLTKRLSSPPGSVAPTHIKPSYDSPSPFAQIIATVSNHLSDSTTPTRLIIPSLLSPLLYPAHASSPQHLLPFLQTLRSLLRQYPTTLTVLVSWSLTLYPRNSSILTRWTEHIADGVISLHPFPHGYNTDSADSDAKAKDTEKMQGLIHVHKLPILSERGLSVGDGEDMAFAMGRRRFVVRPFYLPPLEGEESSAGQVQGEGVGAKGKELEF